MLFRSIGCGLDSRIKRINGYHHPWYDIDFSDVIIERCRFFAESGNYKMLSGDVSSLEWLSGINFDGTAVIIMEGVSMYLAPEIKDDLLIIENDNQHELEASMKEVLDILEDNV